MPSLMDANHLVIGITVPYTAKMGRWPGMGCLPYFAFAHGIVSHGMSLRVFFMACHLALAILNIATMKIIIAPLSTTSISVTLPCNVH